MKLTDYIEKTLSFIKSAKYNMLDKYPTKVF